MIGSRPPMYGRPQMGGLDPYLLMMLMQMQRQQQAQPQEGQGGKVGGLAGLKEIYDLGASKGWWGSGAAGAEAVGGMSGISQLGSSGMGLGEISSIANGNAMMTPNTALQTLAPSTPAPGMFSLSGIGSAGNAVLPLGGAALGYDLFANKRTGLRGGLQGAASGAMMGSYFGPPGAVVGGGIGLAAGLLNRLGDRDRWKEEGDRLKKLRDRGINVVPTEAERLTKGRSKEELIKLEQDKINRGQYGNVAFAQSRNEKDLRPEDIWGYSAFYEKYGNDWLGKFSEADRRRIAQEALDAGAVSEGKGQISVDWNKIPSQQSQPSQQPAPQPRQLVEPVDTRNLSGSPQQTMIPKAPSMTNPNVLAALRGVHGRKFDGAFG